MRMERIPKKMQYRLRSYHSGISLDGISLPENGLRLFSQIQGNLSSSCDFGPMNEGLLLYKIVNGLECARLREKIVTKGSDITLEKVIELCRADELSKYRKKEEGSSEFSKIEQITRNQIPTRDNKGSNNRSGLRRCTFCGYNHKARKCPAYGKKCNRCYKMNHFQRCCMMKAVSGVNCENVQLNPEEPPNKNYGSVYFIEHIEGNDNSFQNEIYKNGSVDDCPPERY